MKPRFPIAWIAAGGVALSVGIGFALHQSARENTAPLPVATRADLPEQFNQAAQTARETLRALPRDPAALRKLAHLYQANRFFPEARAVYRTLEEIKSLDARDHYCLADIAQNESDLERALTELRAAVALEPSYLPAQVVLADALFKSGREDEAEKTYTAISVRAPLHPQATVGLARLALQRGDDNAAVALLEKLLAAHPESTSAAALLAQVLSRRGESERAEALAQWSRQKHEPVASDPWMTELLADCYDRQRLALKFEEYFFSGQITEAVPFLRRIEELDPQSAIPPLLRGWSQSRSNHDAEAVEEFRTALARGGDAEKIVPLMVTSLLKLDRVPEAAGLAGEYHRKLPSSQAFLLAYADAVVRLGSEEKTREILTELLAGQPYLYAQNLELAKILWKSGERDEAAKCLRRIVQFYPNDVASRGLLGQYYLEKSEPRSAIAPLEEALSQAGTETAARERLSAMLVTAHLQVAGAALEKASYAEAVESYDRLLRLDPKNLEAYLGKANACAQLQQFGRAAEALEKMATLDPENPTIFLSLGDVLFQSGDSVAARRRWEQAVQLVAPRDAELKAVLNRRLSGNVSVEDFK
jgi:tetratricopeptide (TPR) repeat protein